VLGNHAESLCLEGTSVPDRKIGKPVIVRTGVR